MSTSAPHSPLDRDSTTLAEATPWYLNETLSDEDRAWFEAELGKNDRLSNALAFDRQIAATLEQRADEVPADLGWDKLLRKVRADSAPPVAVASPGIAQQIGGYLWSLLTPGVGVAMAAVLVAQTVAIGILVEREPTPDAAEYRSVGGLQPTPVIRAIINETTTEKQLRESLNASGASIVSGPSQMGEYLLKVEDGIDRTEVAETLQKNGVLVSFSLDTRVIGQ